MPAIRGLIFDLDGTLVDSHLDFEAIRREIGLPVGHAILETLARLPADERAAGQAILERHEWDGARRATLVPGVTCLLALLADRKLPLALVTRNQRAVTRLTLERLALQFEIVLAREDAPAKPDPAGLLHICRHWGLNPHFVAMVGDYHFDLEAGRRAGTRTVLYTRGRPVESLRFDTRADLVVHCFSADLDRLLAWIDRPGESP